MCTGLTWRVAPSSGIDTRSGNDERLPSIGHIEATGARDALLA
jgi:hypothetical protein